MLEPALSKPGQEAIMEIPVPPREPTLVEPEDALQRYVGQPFSVADQVILCCFGFELTGERKYEQLRRALSHAGFNGPLARHTINTSPLLRHGPNRSYHLERFQG